MSDLVTVNFSRGAWFATTSFVTSYATWADTPQAALSDLADTFASQCEWYARQAERAAEVAAEARRMAKEYEQ